MLACLAMALAGFLTFGDKTQGNILNNFPKDNVMVNVARVLVAHRLLAKVPTDKVQSFWPKHVNDAPTRSIALRSIIT